MSESYKETKENEKNDIKSLYLDFRSFKLDIKQELQEQFDKQLLHIDKHLSNLKYWGIGAVTIFCIVFAYVFDNRLDNFNNRLDDTKEYNQARMEKLESVLFSLASDDL